MICPFGNCSERYERQITYDQNGKVSKIRSFTQPLPAECLGQRCPFYIPVGEIGTTEECRRVNMMLDE